MKRSPFVGTALLFFLLVAAVSLGPRLPRTVEAAPPGEELQVEVNKKGLGKEVVIHRGTREWYMLVEVAEGNTVVIRQEKDGETYLQDESETHDRALSKPEVDSAIDDFINSVKSRVKKAP